MEVGNSSVDLGAQEGCSKYLGGTWRVNCIPIPLSFYLII